MPRYTDIELTDKEIEDCCTFRTVDTIIRFLRYKQARKYLEKHLEEFDATCVQKGRCWTAGSSSFRRIDGKPITDYDIEAIKVLDKGQCNIISGKAGDLVVKHLWECDSSD